MSKSVLDGRVPAISTGRYVGQWELLARLAEYLRRSREGQYEAMIQREQISANDAYRDEQARLAIAADWLAIANRTPRLPDPEVPAGWKTWALEQVLSGIETLIVRTADRGEPIDDHVDLRDATAHLLDCYRNGWTGLLLVDRRRLAAEPQPMRGAA